MHALQSYPLDLLEMNPFTKIGKEWALITTGDKKKHNTMTVSWGGFGVLWNMNVVYIFIRDSRYTKEFLDNGEFFSMSFFSEDYRKALNYCGAHSGREVDKFQEAGLTPVYRHGIPYPDEANLVLICRKLAEVPITKEHFTDKKIDAKFYEAGDYHTMYVGEVVEAAAR